MSKPSRVSQKACAEDPRVEKAVNLKMSWDARLKESDSMNIPDAMLLAKFLPEEASDPTLQARVRRLYHVRKPKTVPKVVGGATNEPTSANAGISADEDVSPITLTPSSSIVRNLYPSSSSSTKRSRSSSSGSSSRRSAKDIRKADVQKQHHDKMKSHAIKFATKMHQDQRDSGGRTSAQACADAANKLCGTNISRKMVSECVNNGRTGKSPLRTGPKAPLGIPHRTTKVLAEALESFIHINQQNGATRFNQRPNMQAVLKAAVFPVVAISTHNLLDRLRSVFTANAGVSLKDSVEERRIRWTTYRNLSTWFDNWESDLEQLGFGSTVNGTFVIPPSQLGRILNIDETAMSLDGSNANKGGRPPTQFCDTSLPNPGTATTKSSACITAICGSTAAGEAVPIHLQFATKSQDDRRVLQFETFKHLPRIRGTFGHCEEKFFPCTAGMSGKGGMDSEQFHNCIITCMVPLHPDVRDMPGKRVMIKVDSGPGRNNVALMTRLRCMGFCFCATAPNTAAVCQETDQSYGCFKSLHCENLQNMTFDRIVSGKSTTVNVSLIGILMFGGVDPVTGLSGSMKPAFDMALTKERNLRMWSKVGAAPLTRACLNHHLVRHTNDDDDPLSDILNGMVGQNDVACTVLTARGLDGEKLRVALKRAPKKPGTVAVKNSVEQIEALAKAGTAGAGFHMTGSGHSTSDAAFMSAEESARDAKQKAMEMDKKKRNSACDIIQRALKIQESLENSTVDELSVADVAVLLRWCGVKTTAMGKLKQEKVAKLKKIREENKRSPLTAKPWTQAKENELQRLIVLKGKIKMGDAETGRHDAVKKQELKAAALNLNMEERQEMINMWKEKDASAEDSAEASVEETAPAAP